MSHRTWYSRVCDRHSYLRMCHLETLHWALEPLCHLLWVTVMHRPGQGGAEAVGKGVQTMFAFCYKVL